MKAFLLLADGTLFEGVSLGAAGTAIGEVVFATGMVGFEETLTDPSYYGQIITQTYPLIGNYGMNREDKESPRVWARGYIVRESCRYPSNFRSEQTLDAFLKQEKVVAIEGIDTRRLTRILRSHGVMNGAVTTEYTPETREELLAAIRPAAVVCCASSDRRYQSADPELLQMIAASGARLCFSDCPPVPREIPAPPPHRAVQIVLAGGRAPEITYFTKEGDVCHGGI